MEGISINGNLDLVCAALNYMYLIYRYVLLLTQVMLHVIDQQPILKAKIKYTEIYVHVFTLR